MLEAAMRELQKGAHAQFLASLPLAATFDEGELGYQLCRVDQVRVSAAGAGTFIDRIRRGEMPKLDGISIGASTNLIAKQVALVRSAQDAAGKSYARAETASWKVRDQESAIAQETIVIREKFKTVLRDITRLDPDGLSLDGTIPYAGLETAERRAASRNDVQSTLMNLLAAGPVSGVLTNAGEMGQGVLQVNRAFAEIRSARNRIDSIPQQIRIEEERVGAVNGVILGTQDKISAYQLAIGIANSIEFAVSIHPVPPDLSCTTSFKPGAIASAIFPSEIIPSSQAISLRRDVYGFSEIRFNELTGAFEIDTTQITNQIKRFQAFLIRSLQPADSGFWLRLEFPLTWGQQSRSTILPGADQPFVIKVNPVDWNVRMTGASARIMGNNVAPGLLEVPIEFYQYGKIQLPGYFPRTDPNRYPTFYTVNLPLYYDDPAQAANSPFRVTFNASFNANPPAPGLFEDNVELSPFCDRYVLLIRRGGRSPC